jgi:hypothetical protein
MGPNSYYIKGSRYLGVSTFRTEVVKLSYLKGVLDVFSDRPIGFCI